MQTNLDRPGCPVAPQFYYTQTGTNYYFGGKLVKDKGGFVYLDRQGSLGKYYPYGVERPSATTNGIEKFTGYFRDSESGNDYADQRYYVPGNGRFLTPDRRNGSPADPNSLNKYAYVGGDPINRVDRHGTDFGDDDSGDPGSDYGDGGGSGDTNPDDVEAALENFEGTSTTPCYGEGATPGVACLSFLLMAGFDPEALEPDPDPDPQQQAPPDPCPGIAQKIWNTITGQGMPGGKSLLLRVVQQITGSQAGFQGHQIQINGFRNRLQNLADEWNDDDCGGNPPYGTLLWIQDTSAATLRKYNSTYNGALAKLASGAAGAAAAVAAAATAIYQFLAPLETAIEAAPIVLVF